MNEVVKQSLKKKKNPMTNLVMPLAFNIVSSFIQIKNRIFAMYWYHNY